ncbi:oxidoreductase [Marmoricola endophyticus]|uniref:Oxidoreductase n=1 Tax=Marmoricola endophyticus TaxID=2040280 RepID=A0A917BKK8_9ACTN|nr:oxidoreductase [Marmoricola endophyticus]
MVVLTHGFPMDHRQWRLVLPDLDGLRCVLPTLPLGAHRHAMRPGTDLTQAGQARILADFLDALDLHEVTLVMSDWGGPAFVVAQDRAERVARMVMVSCEAFDNFPPPPARPAALLCRAPGGTWLLTQLMRTSLLRHGRHGYGSMSHARVPDEVMDAWFEPARRDPLVRRDLRAFATGTPRRSTLLQWSARLADFDRPALVVWAADDTMMPLAHGRRLAELLPQGRYVEVADSRTLVTEDQPEVLARLIRDFVGGPED